MKDPQAMLISSEQKSIDRCITYKGSKETLEESSDALLFIGDSNAVQQPAVNVTTCLQSDFDSIKRMTNNDPSTTYSKHQWVIMLVVSLVEV
jgi:hypothetical protein